MKNGNLIVSALMSLNITLLFASENTLPTVYINVLKEEIEQMEDINEFLDDTCTLLEDHIKDFLTRNPFYVQKINDYEAFSSKILHSFFTYLFPEITLSLPEAIGGHSYNTLINSFYTTPIFCGGELLSDENKVAFKNMFDFYILHYFKRAKENPIPFKRIKGSNKDKEDSLFITLQKNPINTWKANIEVKLKHFEDMLSNARSNAELILFLRSLQNFCNEIKTEINIHPRTTSQQKLLIKKRQHLKECIAPTLNKLNNQAQQKLQRQSIMAPLHARKKTRTEELS